MVHAAARSLRPLALLALLALVALLELVAAPRPVRAGDPDPKPKTDAARTWATSLEDGRAAARASGRPVLVVTCWKEGTCHSCDTWRDRVPHHDDVKSASLRFELVEWHYDGLGGKVIAWTRDHGGTSDDPAAQAFVVDADGKVLSRVDDDVLYAPSRFAAWLNQEADAFEKSHPRTRVPFVPATVKLEGTDASARPVCAELDAARKDERRALVYVGRSAPTSEEASTAETKAELRAVKKFEKDVLGSKRAAEAVPTDGDDPWVLVRLDLSDATHAKFAASLGVTKAPALVVIAPKLDAPRTLPPVTSGASLAHQLDKLFE